MAKGKSVAASVPCPINRATFRDKAPAELPVTIGGKAFEAHRKEYKTGSFGWYLTGKATVTIDGIDVTLNVNLNVTCVGSKLHPLEV